MATRAGSRRALGRGTRAGGRHLRGVATRKDIPADLAERWELLVKLAGDNLYELHRKIRQAVGQRPYKGMPVTEQERARRWAEVVSSPEDIAELFQSNAKFTVDGRVLVPNELLEEMSLQHTHRRKGGYS